jgi:hypothetical protein
MFRAELIKSTIAGHSIQVMKQSNFKFQRVSVARMIPSRLIKEIKPFKFKLLTSFNCKINQSSFD